MAHHPNDNAGSMSGLNITIYRALEQAQLDKNSKKIKALARSASTHAEIAAALGIGRSTVSESLRRNGIRVQGVKPHSARPGLGLRYGWRIGERGVEPCPLAQRAIDRMIRLRRAGRTYREIADALEAEGFQTLTGSPWAAATVLGIIRREKSSKGT